VDLGFGERRVLRRELEGEGDLAALDGQPIHETCAHDVPAEVRVDDPAERTEDGRLGDPASLASTEETHTKATIREPFAEGQATAPYPT